MFCLFSLQVMFAPVMMSLVTRNTRDLFLEGPKRFLHPESHSKISNLMITELCYSDIFLTSDRGFLHTRSFMYMYIIQLYVQINKKQLCQPKTFLGLLRNGPQDRHGLERGCKFFLTLQYFLSHLCTTCTSTCELQVFNVCCCLMILFP